MFCQIDMVPLVAAGPQCHCGEVLSMATCIRKPLLASISSDQTVRLWNFRDKYAGSARPSLGPCSALLHANRFKQSTHGQHVLRCAVGLTDDVQTGSRH